MLIELVKQFLSDNNLSHSMLWKNNQSVHVFVHSDFIPHSSSLDMKIGNAGAWIFTKKQESEENDKA